MKRTGLLAAAAAAALLAGVGVSRYVAVEHKRPASPAPASPGIQTVHAAVTADQPPPTRIHAHNLLLRKGPDFRIYVRWLNGQLVRTNQNVDPSLDEPNSFVLEVQQGVVHAQMADISHFMNSGAGPDTPLRDISITGDKDHISLHGTIHKLHIPLPIALEGAVSASPDGRIHLQVNHLSVLKVPLKGVLGSFHLTIADLMGGKKIPGIEATGNDLYFDTQTLLPAPHIHGKLSTVHVVNPDIVVMYGDNAKDDVARTEQWHNFLALKGGTLGFGKLTMHQVDLIMIDASKDPWFDLDLVNYQAQLVYGYTRMTPQAGLQIFMPDLDELPQQQAPKAVTAQWIKDRSLPPPPAGLPATD